MHKLLPPKLVALLMIGMILLAVVAPWPEFGWPVRSAGLALLAVGLVINVAHARLFAQIGTNIKTFDDPETLVTSGAFQWTRNPMYLGFLFILLGVALALGAATAFVGPAAFFLAAQRWYIPFEEGRMAATFGADYRTYRSHVRRWFGRRSLT